MTQSRASLLQTCKTELSENQEHYFSTNTLLCTFGFSSEDGEINTEIKVVVGFKQEALREGPILCSCGPSLPIQPPNLYSPVWQIL